MNIKNYIQDCLLLMKYNQFEKIDDKLLNQNPDNILLDIALLRVTFKIKHKLKNWNYFYNLVKNDENIHILKGLDE